MLAHLALLLVAATPVETVPSGTHVVYEGRFVAEKNEGAGEKRFDLTVHYARPESAPAIAYWTSNEQGQGSWSWLDRFGKVELNEALRSVSGPGPSLLYVREDLTSSVPLTMPLVTYREPFATDVSWIEGGLEHRVVEAEKVGEIDCWRIDVRGPIGRKRIIWVDKQSPVVIAMNETVFIGQGEQHVLRYELKTREVLDGEKSAKVAAAMDEFLRLRQRLEFPPQTRDFQWTSDRLAILKADLPDILAKAKDTPLMQFASAAEQEAKNDKGRSQALDALHGKVVGMPAPKPDLQTTSGETFSWPSLDGKVTVLHFWEYRDMPLEEPYGQVAYLDYLNRKYSGSDVRVFGIVANESVAEPSDRRSAVQSAKRLHAFMNLSYPLLVDHGKAIKQFGDPRTAGGKLPLFLVIDRTGKVLHYHSGHYEVNRDRGLEELDQVIRKAGGVGE